MKVIIYIIIFNLILIKYAYTYEYNCGINCIKEICNYKKYNTALNTINSNADYKNMINLSLFDLYKICEELNIHSTPMKLKINDLCKTDISIAYINNNHWWIQP